MSVRAISLAVAFYPDALTESSSRSAKYIWSFTSAWSQLGWHFVMQQKTQRPVQFEITEQTRDSVEAWIKAAGLLASDFLFPGRIHATPHLPTRQYSSLVHAWIRSIRRDDTAYGMHTMHRTKASLIYHPTNNLRAVQLLLCHTKLGSTVRFFGIEVDYALEMAEQTKL